MAKRLATHYLFLKLDLTRSQMQSFLKLFDTQQTPTQVLVLENGDQELIIQDQGLEIPLTFHPYGKRYVFEGSFILKDVKLANTFRAAVQQFEGHAQVRRMYEGYHMEYSYAYGNVTRIEECRGEQTRLIYEYKDTLGEMTRMYADRTVEDEIEWTQLQINQLLDQRLKGEFIQEIDQKLKELSHQLFVLEAL